MKKYRHKPSNEEITHQDDGSYLFNKNLIAHLLKSEDFEEIVEQKYLKPKTDNDRVFNFVKCEGLVHDEDEKYWMDIVLIAYNKKLKHFICANGFVWQKHEIRIPMFSPENPPPVDTLVQTCNSEIMHFSGYTKKEEVTCYAFGTSKSTNNPDPEDGGTEVIYSNNISFTGFPESDYEEYEDQ